MGITWARCTVCRLRTLLHPVNPAASVGDRRLLQHPGAAGRPGGRQ